MRLGAFALIFISATAALCSGCDSIVVSDFTDDMVHEFEQNTATLPPATAEDEFPEVMTLVQQDSDPFDFVHGRGYIHTQSQRSGPRCRRQRWSSTVARLQASPS